MDPLIRALLTTWASHRDYVQKLVADVPEAEMVSQPVPGVVMNHPAWTLGHLLPYCSTVASMVRGEAFPDPANSPFAKGSSPSADAGVYPKKAELVAAFIRAHDDAAAALERADVSVMSRPIPLERWKARFPTVGDAVVYLMTSHEATHLGQLSAWRRAGKRPSV
ncbi:MAG TPA: DinB family protein [Phycisphaerales bacterium]|nr:DinB family protein [Phycisphaerales bacterium]